MNTSTTRRRRRPIDAADHLGLVYKLAAQVHRTLGGKAELGDLIAAGAEGLLHACDRYDPSQGYSFATFAYQRIHGAILDGVRASCPLSGRQYRRVRASGATGIWTEPLGDHPADRPPADEQVDSGRLARVLALAIERLPERERDLVRGHYWRDQNLLEAGADLGLTKSGASRMHSRALDHLRQQMEAVLGGAATAA
ncbi:MAG TPA: sigma-70 family RNA polymerase sigma factor [Kofleriaceae bacterium]|nr:sigma-70 family RNA polymerase sigma factor [Kofleriaceae bacterium]